MLYLVFNNHSLRKILFFAFPIPCDYDIIPVISQLFCEANMKAILKKRTDAPEFYRNTAIFSAQALVSFIRLSWIIYPSPQCGYEAR